MGAKKKQQLEDRPHIPSASTILKAGDQVIALTTHGSEEELRAALRGS